MLNKNRETFNRQYDLFVIASGRNKEENEVRGAALLNSTNGSVNFSLTIRNYR